MERKLFISSLMFALIWAANGALCSDDDLIPSHLPKNQRENLQRFLAHHDKPDRYIPSGARILGTRNAAEENSPEPAPAVPGKPIKQYTVQIMPHRPVPGQ